MINLQSVRNIAIALFLVCAVSGARAQEQYPARAITIVVPFAAGGPTDVLARIVAQNISPMLGQQVIVENTTGAGGHDWRGTRGQGCARWLHYGDG